MIALQVAVRIPGSGPATAVLDLDEPDPAFHQTAAGQHLHAEFAGLGPVEAVEALGLLGFAGKIEGGGQGTLHAVGQFVAGQPG